jgi:hypothetical protein
MAVVGCNRLQPASSGATLRRRIGRKDPREDEDDAQIVFRGCTAIGRLQAPSSKEAARAGRTGPVSPNSFLAARREATHSSANDDGATRYNLGRCSLRVC